MAINIDGKIYRSEFKIKFGQEFPQEKKNREMRIGGFGYVNIYIISLGKPRWEKDLTVRIPVRFYITDIIRPEKEHERRRQVKKSRLKLLNGFK